MPTDRRTYQDRETGAIGEFSPKFAAHYPNLVEVDAEPDCGCTQKAEPAPEPVEEILVDAETVDFAPDAENEE